MTTWDPSKWQASWQQHTHNTHTSCTCLHGDFDEGLAQQRGPEELPEGHPEGSAAQAAQVKGCVGPAGTHDRGPLLKLGCQGKGWECQQCSAGWRPLQAKNQDSPHAGQAKGALAARGERAEGRGEGAAQAPQGRGTCCM